MARISLKCGCGWNFFVPGSTQGHEAACPNCGNAVGIPGRKATGGGAKAPGVIAAEMQARQKQVLLLISIAAAVVLVAVVLLMMGGRSTPPEPAPSPEPVSKFKVTPKLPTTPGTSSPRPDAEVPDYKKPETEKGPNTEALAEGHRQSISALVARLNMAGVALESLRLRGHAEAVSALQENMKAWQATIDEKIAKLLELGVPYPVPLHVQPGDRLIAFGQKDFASISASKIDQELLSPWLRTFKAELPLEQAVFLRGTQRIELYLSFKQATEDLQQLSRLPDSIGPGRYPEAAAFEGTPGAPLPETLLKEVETRFQAIPAGYRQLLPFAEVQRLDQILKHKMGSPEDLGFLQGRILSEALPGFEREVAIIKAKIAELQQKAKEPIAVDVVFMKDGRRLEGRVVQQPAGGIRLQMKLGNLPLKEEDILRIELGKGAGAEFPNELKKTPSTPAGLSGLLGWCQGKNLKVEAEYVAALLVSMDPLHEAARKLAGLPARPATKAAGTAGPGPGSPGATSPAAGGDSPLKAMDLLAAEVLAKNPPFGDVIERMRSGSIGVTVSSAPSPAPRAGRAVQLIQDPLTFSLSNLDAAAALEIGQWWGSFSPDDRREFARFYGLWCAHRRLGGR